MLKAVVDTNVWISALITASRIRTEDIKELLDLIESSAHEVPIEDAPAVSRDPKDDPYIACALAAACYYLVSGDKDLLSLQEHSGIKIITPAAFQQVMKHTLLSE